MAPLEDKQPLGRTGILAPPIVFGTSALGNLYQALPYETKREILEEAVERVAPPVAIDTAGKYGAGLALETIGTCLRDLGVSPDRVVISNKLGWARAPLTTPEPTFEPGAWIGLEHDAEQRIDYDGILHCWEQGCELLGGDYRPALVSVHDPDEYLAAARDEADRARRFEDILGAYRALGELRARGEVRGVGVGAKDWNVIHRIAEAVDLDWVMLACSLTLWTHPPDLLSFVERLDADGVGVINSAVFQAGFLSGGKYFDYRVPDPDDPDDRWLFEWRDRFFEVCRRHDVGPAEACVEFGMSPPAVVSVSLNTSRPERVARNVDLVRARAPEAFWTNLKDEGLIARDYPYLG